MYIQIALYEQNYIHFLCSHPWTSMLKFKTGGIGTKLSDESGMVFQTPC